MESACAVLYCGVLLVCLSFTVYQVVKKKPTVYDMSLSHKHTIFRKKAPEHLIFVLISFTTLKKSHSKKN